jgi:hypothetical protein
VSTNAVVRTVAGTRAAIGLTLAVATRRFLRLTVGQEQQSGPFVLFARTVGVRDLVFGAGSLVAATGDADPVALRRWLVAWAASDVADVLAALSARDLDRSGALAAAAAPLPFLVAGVWALSRLGRPAQHLSKLDFVAGKP